MTYWAWHNKSTVYSRKLRKQITQQLDLLSRRPDRGKSTGIQNVHAKVFGNFAIYYSFDEKYLNVLVIWDCRRNPDDLPILLLQ
ncbi:MAG: hypothetical protein ACKVOR_14030 [Flavobacteriales bacterium]